MQIYIYPQLRAQYMADYVIINRQFILTRTLNSANIGSDYCYTFMQNENYVSPKTKISYMNSRHL